jgi:hypothetical protein
MKFGAAWGNKLEWAFGQPHINWSYTVGPSDYWQTSDEEKQRWTSINLDPTEQDDEFVRTFWEVRGSAPRVGCMTSVDILLHHLQLMRRLYGRQTWIQCLSKRVVSAPAPIVRRVARQSGQSVDDGKV